LVAAAVGASCGVAGAGRTTGGRGRPGDHHSTSRDRASRARAARRQPVERRAMVGTMVRARSYASERMRLSSVSTISRCDRRSRVAAPPRAEEDFGLAIAHGDRTDDVVMPNCVTIGEPFRRLLDVLRGAGVTFSGPNTSSSATRHRTHGEPADDVLLGVVVPVLSGSENVMPSARPARHDRHLVERVETGTWASRAHGPPRGTR